MFPHCVQSKSCLLALACKLVGVVGGPEGNIKVFTMLPGIFHRWYNIFGEVLIKYTCLHSIIYETQPILNGLWVANPNTVV
jgi:hypothetical protein